jgi:hypothetical protein
MTNKPMTLAVAIVAAAAIGGLMAQPASAQNYQRDSQSDQSQYQDQRQATRGAWIRSSAAVRAMRTASVTDTAAAMTRPAEEDTMMIAIATTAETISKPGGASVMQRPTRTMTTAITNNVAAHQIRLA